MAAVYAYLVLMPATQLLAFVSVNSAHIRQLGQLLQCSVQQSATEIEFIPSSVIEVGNLFLWLLLSDVLTCVVCHITYLFLSWRNWNHSTICQSVIEVDNSLMIAVIHEYLVLFSIILLFCLFVNANFLLHWFIWTWLIFTVFIFVYISFRF